MERHERRRERPRCLRCLLVVRRAAKMKRVSQVLQFSIIVQGRRPFARESQLLEKLNFFPGCIALQGGILKERLKSGLLVALGGFPFDELKSLRVPGRQTAVEYDLH